MIVSERGFDVTFKSAYLQRLRQARPAKVAVLVTNEYEGIFRNGGIGTYYRRLSEQLTAGGWYVLLLLTWAEKRYAGESEFPAVAHIFSTAELPEVLNLQPVHLGALSGRAQDWYAYQSACCLLFTQAVVRCFADAPVYVEFPDIMGTGCHTVHAARAGLFGQHCITAVTMHGCHEWVDEASEKHSRDHPAGWFWQASYSDSLGFEDADLSFYPSHALRAKVETYGWNTARAVHMPYFVPLVDATGAGANGLPAVGEGKVPVVFFGRLEERKGLCTFVEALGALPAAVRRKVHVVFLGKIVPLYSAELAHLDSREYIEGALPADVSYSVLSDLYSAQALGYVRTLRAPVVCLTSPQENFPNTGLEMGQLPVKLVVSDTGGFRETLGLVQRTAGVYWFEPKNAGALAEALRRAIAEEGGELVVARPADIARTNRALLARKEALIEQALTRAGTVHVERPRVSVAVLWGRQGAALLECLESLAGQRYGDLEVLVVDQGEDEGEAREVLEHARGLFPQYRFVRLPRGGSAGRAWNHALELAEGEYFLGLEGGTVLAPFAVDHLVRAARHAPTALVSYSVRARPTGDEIPGYAGGPLARLLETGQRGSPGFLGATSFLRRFRRLEEGDALTHGWEVLAAAVATGERIVHYPYPLGEAVEGLPGALAEPARLKQQYQLRQYVGQIPPAQWSPRQLALLLMATQQLLAQGTRTGFAELADAERAKAAEELARLRAAHDQVQTELRAAHDQVQSELRAAHDQVQTELRATYDQAQTELRAAHDEVQTELRAAHDQAQTELRAAHDQAQVTQAALEQTRAELQLAHRLIAAMESSRFWKLRGIWFRLKQALRIPCN